MVVVLIGATVVRGQADRTAMAARDARYQAEAQAIDEARAAAREREQARRSASMQ